VGGGGVWIRGEVEGVDGYRGVGAVAGEPGIGEVTNDEPGPSGQAEQRGALSGLLDRDGREIHSGQGDVRGAREPEARAAAAAAQVDQRLSGCEVQGAGHVAEQAEGDEGEGLDLGREFGHGELPDLPEARGGRDG